MPGIGCKQSVRKRMNNSSVRVELVRKVPDETDLENLRVRAPWHVFLVLRLIKSSDSVLADVV